jgi:hypothetical protein
MVLVTRVLQDKPVPPHELVPQVPQWLSTVVMWALSKDRGKRPQSARELEGRLTEGE